LKTNPFLVEVQDAKKTALHYVFNFRNIGIYFFLKAEKCIEAFTMNFNNGKFWAGSG
jgi:hypothetical protein